MKHGHYGMVCRDPRTGGLVMLVLQKPWAAGEWWIVIALAGCRTVGIALDAFEIVED